MEAAKPFPIYQLMDAFEAFTHGEPMAKPQHRSLYYYLLGRARKLGNMPSYTLPYENGMHGSGIGSWATYDAALKMLAEWGFITYTPGANRFKAPVVAIQFRNPTDDVLLTYWQSYCLSTCSPIDNSTGDNNRLIDFGKKRIKELETYNDAANAAALCAQKKIEELEAQLLALQPASPEREASHTGGPADVPTRKARKPVLLLTGPLSSLLNPGGLADAVQGLKKPFTQAQADQLVSDHGAAAATEIVQAMANHARLGSYVSSYLTANNWLSKRKTTNAQPHASPFRTTAPANGVAARLQIQQPDAAAGWGYPAGNRSPAPAGTARESF